jgi:hypothetical protein
MVEAIITGQGAAGEESCSGGEPSACSHRDGCKPNSILVAINLSEGRHPS